MAEPGMNFSFESKEAAPFSYEELKAIIDNIREEIYNRPEGIGIDEFQQHKIADLIENLLSEKEKFSQIFKTEKGSIYFGLDSGETLRIKNEAASGQPANYSIQPFTGNIFFVPKKEFERIFKIATDHWEIYRRPFGVSDTSEDRACFDRRKKFYEEAAKKTFSDDEFRSIDISRSGINRLMGEPIVTADLKEGVVPVEFGFAEDSQNTRMIYRLENDNLILLGREDIMADGEVIKDPDTIGIYHFGHPVSEVIFDK